MLSAHRKSFRIDPFFKRGRRVAGREPCEKYQKRGRRVQGGEPCKENRVAGQGALQKAPDAGRRALRKELGEKLCKKCRNRGERPVKSPKMRVSHDETILEKLTVYKQFILCYNRVV